MPTRNVYVSSDDADLFERAGVLAGGLSAAVAAGLRMYVAAREREEGAGEMNQIEVEINDGPVVTVKRFTGRRILRYEDRDGTRVTTYRVYATAHGQLAVYRRDDPDWSALSAPDEKNPVWNNPRTWDGKWWQSGERSLSVFRDTVAMAGVLPDPVVAAVEVVLTKPAVEDLDI